MLPVDTETDLVPLPYTIMFLKKSLIMWNAVYSIHEAIEFKMLAIKIGTANSH